MIWWRSVRRIRACVPSGVVVRRFVSIGGVVKGRLSFLWVVGFVSGEPFALLVSDVLRDVAELPGVCDELADVGVRVGVVFGGFVGESGYGG